MTRVLVTGASDGLGRALAFALAERGYQLVVHGRDTERLAEVAERTGAQAIQADLASLAEVRRLAAAVEGDLDVLVNNAGIGFGAPGAPRQLSADGYELRLAVNYLAPYLLTRLLIPRLKRSAPARIVNVASVGQRPFDVDDPMMERGYDGTEAYRRAKLALVAYTFDLAEELAGTGVTANCLHPATLMPTTMVRQAGTPQVDTLETGLRSTLRLVVDPALAGVTGRYFDRDRPGRALDQAYDLDFRKRLRDLSESLTRTRG
ncbi:SDR family NAD(P)-dependent oxidoreductase [Phytohabitans sp. ZYX-F-186]|uniref:SDR family NAD(P)-dependent oxidoreductase n=1 Tax=Phytohabitans maris TaxID=3071409 RepID=A0ABU0ZMN8_9ACTN|nr:SDR family NAD(P)-dependent oxidoreductase [Phytohabitans sp. ZYX-F-186]MDQ7907207.1 SDR family NAD(P)-dependent oxidoreductase [Phytohabitans sp. ZYX-F-186]